MARKKVLVISYYWPPAGGAGVQRVVKFVKYLPHFGYDPVVLTVKKGEYPTYDESLLQDIPKEVEVVKTKTLEFFRLFKMFTGRSQKKGLPTTLLKREASSGWERLFRWIRYTLFLPDARVGWKPYAVRAGMKLIRKHHPEIIFCTSPPHSVQIIGQSLHRRTGIPWVADFRDPWTDAFWLWELPNYPRAYRRNINLEKEIIGEANAVVTVSEGFSEVLKKVDRPIEVITNGYDEESFTGYQKRSNKKFSIVYTGTLSKTQHPGNLLCALEELCVHEGLDIQFDLYGAIDEYFTAEVRRLGLESVVKEHGYIPYSEAVQRMFDADMLLLLSPRTEMRGITPQKIFEYMATENFVLGIGSPDDDPARILRECEAGVYVDFSDDIRGVLRERYEAWKTPGQAFAPTQEKVKQYTRKALTGKLASVFDKVLINK